MKGLVLISLVLCSSCLSIRAPTRRSAAIKYSRNTWPIRRVLYDMKGFDADEETKIRQAMDRIEQEVGPHCAIFVKWLQYEPTEDYLEIVKAKSCGSKVGLVGGKQVTRLASKCVQKEGIVIHELMHVLGLKHEHLRPDRDQYVTIYRDNIQQSHLFDFRIDPDTETFGLPYDYDSIMNFRDDFFAKTLGLKTIVANNGHQIGQRDHLSQNDITSVRKLYECGGTLTLDCDFSNSACGLFTSTMYPVKWKRHLQGDIVVSDHSGDGYYFGIDTTDRGAGGAIKIKLPASPNGYCIKFWYYRYKKLKNRDYFYIFKQSKEGETKRLYLVDWNAQQNYWDHFQEHYDWFTYKALVIHAVRVTGYADGIFAMDDLSIKEAVSC